MIAWLWMASLEAKAGKTTKIEAALAAYDAGDAEAGTEALERVEKALGKAPDDPALLVLVGRIELARAQRDPAAAAAALEHALAAFERAGTPEGAVRAQAEAAVLQLASVLVADLTNQVEAKQWEDAQAGVDRCQRAFAVATRLGQRDAEREAAYQRLATRVAVQVGDLASARAHFATLHELTGTWDGALAVRVARKLAESGGGAAGSAVEATNFLFPILEAMPTDEGLLRAWVELSAADPDAAVARLDNVRRQLLASKSGALLLGELYDQCGRRDQARAAYEGLLAQEPTNIQANQALAKFWLASAQATRAQIDGETAATLPSREQKRLLTTQRADLVLADQYATAAVAAGPEERPVLELLAQILEARIAAAAKGDKSLADATSRLTTTQARLAALQASE